MSFNTYKCIFDNNVELKIDNYIGNDNDIKKMYDFYNGGSLLLREQKKRIIITNLINNNVLDKNKNFIDGGSFLGDTTLPLALNINGIVFSIDPGDINIDIINNLTKLNNIKNVKTLKYCLGSTCGKLFYNKGPYANNFNSFSTQNGDLEYSIDSISLDELCNTKIIENIDFIHIDVENLETEVLKGSEKIIYKYNPIIIFEGHIKSFKIGVKDSIRFLNNMNYIIYMIDEDAGNINDARNFIAIPKERYENFKNNFDYFDFLLDETVYYPLIIN